MLSSQSTKTDIRGGSLMSLAGSPELQPSRSASRIASVTEPNSVIASLALAFSDDPAARWLSQILTTRHQGRGHGSELLRRVLTQCDRHDLPAYLESSNPKNVPFYQRHGFRVTGTIQAGTSPQILPMLRQPKSST